METRISRPNDPNSHQKLRERNMRESSELLATGSYPDERWAKPPANRLGIASIPKASRAEEIPSATPTSHVQKS
jgi:hypothetical protein